MGGGTSQYADTGVDVTKAGTGVFKAQTVNVFPHAFCIVQEHPLLPGYGIIPHQDGVGSKTLARYLLWRDTGDIEVFQGDATDIIAMNVNDVACVNGTGDGLTFTDYVAINRFTMPKQEYLEQLSLGIKRDLGILAAHGVSVPFGGGETADLPDQVRTVDASASMTGIVDLSKAVTGRHIAPGDVIVGLRSDGKAAWEDEDNSGIMSNGLTLARHCLTHPDYERQYPEIRDPKGKEYYGRFRMTETPDGLGMTVGEALTSPTRFFSPILKPVYERLGADIHGLVNDTGGGQAKSLRIGDGIHYIKDSLPTPPPIFRLIQQESGESWSDMFQDFNNGVGMDLIIPPERASEVLSIAHSLGVGASITGRCEASKDGKNAMTIVSEFGTFEYGKKH